MNTARHLFEPAMCRANNEYSTRARLRVDRREDLRLALLDLTKESNSIDPELFRNGSLARVTQRFEPIGRVRRCGQQSMDRIDTQVHRIAQVQCSTTD